jgi:hypothetical protein
MGMCSVYGDAMLFNEDALRFLKTALTRSWYRDLSGRDLVIAIDMGKSFTGLINNKVKNLLVWNFWALLLGTLGDLNLPFLDVGGAVYSLRTRFDVSVGVAFVVFGTSSAPESFSQYALGSRSTALEGTSISPTIIREGDKRRLRFGRVSAGAVSEVGIYQSVYDSAGTARTAMWCRKVYSVPGAGYNVYYDVIVKPPSLDNLVNILFGIMTNSNQPVTKMDGGTITARSSGDVQGAEAYLLIGTSSDPFSFTNYSLTNPIFLASAYNYLESRWTWLMAILTGATRFTTSYTVAEVGIGQRIYDIGGALYDVLLARIVLPTAISRSAGDVFTVAVTFYASG